MLGNRESKKPKIEGGFYRDRRPPAINTTLDLSLDASPNVALPPLAPRYAHHGRKAFIFFDSPKSVTNYGTLFQSCDDQISCRKL